MYNTEELPGPDPERQSVLVQAWAGLLGRRDVLVLDTETTSLDRPEVVDIGIIDTRGYRRMDRLVMPKYGIEQGAQRVHGISKEHLAKRQAQTFDAVATRLQRLLDEAAVICIYNSGFDLSALKTSGRVRRRLWRLGTGGGEEGPLYHGRLRLPGGLVARLLAGLAVAQTDRRGRTGGRAAAQCAPGSLGLQNDTGYHAGRGGQGQGGVMAQRILAHMQDEGETFTLPGQRHQDRGGQTHAG